MEIHVPPMEADGTDLSEKIQQSVEIRMAGQTFEYIGDWTLKVTRDEGSALDYTIVYSAQDGEPFGAHFTATLPEGQYMAKVETDSGTTAYKTLEEAWEAAVAAKGSTLTLLQSRSLWEFPYVPKDADFTLTMAEGVAIHSEDWDGSVVYGCLTLENCTIFSPAYACVSAFETGCVTVRDSSLQSGSKYGTGAIMSRGGKVVIYSGQFTGRDGANGLAKELDSGEVKLYGGTFTGEGRYESTESGTWDSKAIWIKDSYVSTHTLRDLLADGYAYRWLLEDGTLGEWVPSAELSGKELAGTVTVLPLPLEITSEADAATVTFGYSTADAPP